MAANKRTIVHLPLIVQEPEYFKFVAADSYLGIREVMEIFGYSSTNSTHQAIKNGSLPKPDMKLHVGRGRGTNFAKLKWKVSTIRAEIKRRKEVHEALRDALAKRPPRRPLKRKETV